MEIIIGLLIIAVGAFCQSSCYVPINKIKSWSWESYWIVQGVFAWLVFPLLGALLAVPNGQGIGALFDQYAANPTATGWAFFYGILWGVGGLTFGLSMRYLGVALGQSIALGTCAGLGVILEPIIRGNAAEKLTAPVIIGVVVTLVGIAIIGIAGSMKSASLSEEEKKKAVKDFNFTKGLAVALLAGLASACFALGKGYSTDLNFGGESPEMYAALPAVFMVTLGGFVTNAVYCFYQNTKNKTWGDYGKTSLYINNLFFCALAGVLWYSQFFGLSMGESFFEKGSALLAFSWCILMSFNVIFSNVWGIILKEWSGCTHKTIVVLLIGLAVLIVSSFLPQLLK